MLQIKTIRNNDPKCFDKSVNAYLAAGWTLTSRFISPEGFTAYLEREIITEAERSCENCRHNQLTPEQEPCCFCSEDADQWEEAEV